VGISAFSGTGFGPSTSITCSPEGGVDILKGLLTYISICHKDKSHVSESVTPTF